LAYERFSQVILFWSCLIVFLVSTVALAVYGVHLYVLLFLFRTKASKRRAEQAETIAGYCKDRAAADWPMVTTQIPIYNEKDVILRILHATAAIDYPQGRHEIQVLDDSDDDTRSLVNDIATRMRARGVDITVVRRPTRDGYKAGALAHGLLTAKGQYVAIFDADFVPPAEFLRTAVPLIDSRDNLACLQGRWAHLNQDESWLTEAQSLGIDGHFAIEQGARAWNGLMMNFNGTAGLWRKAAIEDPKVGGWSGDTLTEDLDLSYRAQLAGWKLDYCLDLACPAELPGTVNALKSQQRRWATGSIQVARKLLPRIWRSPVSFGEKIEATLHLTHYSVSMWMLLLALVARPMLSVFADARLFAEWAWFAWGLIYFAALAPSLVYIYARHSLNGKWATGLRTIPGMMILGCGLCVNNTLAVLRGLTLRGGEFIRTPKSGSVGVLSRPSSYNALNSKMWLIEIGLGLYSLACFIVYMTAEYHAFSVFLLLYAVGLCLAGWMSRPLRFQAPSIMPEISPDAASLRPAVYES
jgi:cellulose synthase/poly-beta-1,6-N-acetylglucosamine synthase-like glycosyltransferase